MQNHEILVNNPQQKKYVFSKLSNLLKNEDVTQVTFMVAFITVDGIYLILNELRELLARDVKIVIITGFMHNFNHPKVFELLMQIENLEVRIANIHSYHPKLYRVKTQNSHAYIIGSSNLTNSALRRNLEMNIFFEEDIKSPIISQVEEVYQQLLLESQILSSELLDEYRYKYTPVVGLIQVETPALNIHPNSMQEKALTALSNLRQAGQSRALIISATGSGKTYLSAFDVLSIKPRKLLFIAHRDNILNAAINSYHKVIPKFKYSKLTGLDKNYTGNYIFASIQSLHKDENLKQFKPDYFDYIVVDEVHRAGANSYQKVINYFKPKFLLGMSATPERSDGFDIYQMFDHNIAHEIRLNEALEEDLVCPFHYFGVSELIVENLIQDDYSNFNKIDFNARVTHIIHNLKLYGHSGNKVKGLVFVTRIEEAQKLSELFNQRGFKTIALSGSSSEETRELAIQLLENDYTDAKGKPQDYLDYIFSVDIFNEGIDIPAVNQIVLLRPTQSAIIFVQQLGRGLRKSSAKEYCVVIDFIANYKSNFLIAIALSGNNSYDKESLRRFVCEANSMLPFNATVSFDKITRERIYSSINSILINKKFIDQKYLELKHKINQVPALFDFIKHNSIDPKIIFKYSIKSSKIIYTNYHELLKKHNDVVTELCAKEISYLDYITQELLFAARPDDLFVLLQLILGVEDENIIYANLEQIYNTCASTQKREAIRRILSLETSNALAKKYAVNFVNTNSRRLELTSDFVSYLNNNEFKSLIIQTLKLGLSYFEEYKIAPKYNDFILYNKYSRREVTRLLNVNLALETSIYGYRIIENTIPIFITYNKSHAILANINYDNVFLNNQDFTWYSRPSTRLDNKEIQGIIQHKQQGLTIMIFLKKSDNEGSEHYYLGNADVYQYTPVKLNHKNVVKFIMRLQTPLSDTEYDYIVN